MAKREFGQYCGLARAVEIVGERWALLIIRDLLVGPRRYTDLRNGLPKIPTNILSARLKEMEAAGVVHRRVLPRPDGSVVYELTEYGRDLEEAVMHLSRWGARSLGEPRPGEIVTTASMVLAMRNTFRPGAAAGLTVRYEVRMGETVFHLRLADGALSAGEGPLPDADLVIETGMAIKALMAKEITPDEAVATGAVRIKGDPALLERFAEVFAI
ncbi:hxlR family transcriptional regulator [Planomonospora sphaerica]|uniref:HxlR family transcriptional regulator n=1 Tax=Planomonospora sphaerica TaxID=161355 RepID=A0A171DCP0_9ACTN|nr:winged helix-turn-helix transcriptional regulator [Planomonospora sphaerica]GAT67991.1 hxlR family transcriptional regulator [Planomonospora sphaerica]